MKRGGFWITTVATGVVVLGLMTVGRAGLKSQGILFLQGQMKIAAGDTDSGMRLLAEASSRPQMSASLNNPLETAGEPVKAVEAPKPCKKWSVVPKANSTELPGLRMAPAPEPTLAAISASIPLPPTVQASYMQDATMYITTAQREAIRARQVEFQKEQRIHQQQLRDALRKVSYTYRVSNLPNAREIEIQVQKGLGALAQ